MVPCPEMLCALAQSGRVAGEPCAGCGCGGWWARFSSPDIGLQTPSAVIKVKFPPLVSSCLCWGNPRHCSVLSSEQTKLGQAGTNWAVDAALGSPGISQEG